MKIIHHSHRRVAKAHSNLPGVVLLGVGLLAAWPSRADDRDLLRESSADPYIFILLDTSGSMNWATKCTAQQLAAGDCSQLCPEGDCFTPLNADDPASKFYQAKEALYEVLRNTGNLQLGFATFNQNDLRAQGKHWLYRMQAGEHPTHLQSGQHFPPDGSTQVFGRTFSCNSGGLSTGFAANSPASLTDAWAMARIGRCSQLGQDGTQSGGSNNDAYVSGSDGRKYRLRWTSKSGETLGYSQFTATATLSRCDNSSCSSRTVIESTEITYDLVDEFASWDLNAKRSAPQNGYFSQTQATDASTADGDQSEDSCLGWDPNDDTTDDTFSGVNLRFSTVLHPNPAYRPWMDTGDVIPLDWANDNLDAILDRLAPNRRLGESVPDFQAARYLEDRLNADGILELRNSQARPLFANGSTPLGFAIADFRAWWAGCEQGSCNRFTGWKDLATANDPDWACRKKYLLVLTDGDDTCPGRDPCSFTASLFAQENIRTYVVAFGVQNTAGNRLTCMAANGGTGNPIYPQNKRELIDALAAIFGEIAEDSRSFASAAVPSVQAEVDDKLFLSSFTPLNGTSYWDGHLDAYLKPLPLTADRRPDKSRKCSSLPADRQASCHLWDAGEQILAQAPTVAEIDAANDRLGTAADQRRVFYPLASAAAGPDTVPKERLLLRQASTPPARRDLWDALGISYSLADLVLNSSTPATRAAAIIRSTLVEKSEIVSNPDGTSTPITYVLGDIFHSNPTVVDRPDDFAEFAANRYHDSSDADGQNCTDSSPGYRCFSRKHEFRRKMLTVGANDGQLHFFDAGTWDRDLEKFGNGTGGELFSFIPRMAMPILTAEESGSRQIYSADGSPRTVNVFIDPRYSSSPTPADREWRTVAIAGLREGGSVNGGHTVQLENLKSFSSGYFAIDVTQPDPVDTNSKPTTTGVVPGCLQSYSTESCGPVEFGAELWEFTDSVDGSPAEWGVGLDEDDNGTHDLGATWSTPIVGRIRLQGASALEERWVAIFGGGFDPDNRGNPQRGTWIYMLDVETGLPLYKRPVAGAVPSTPAGVDYNNDGFLDALYVGTTAGYLYKVDLRTAPTLESLNVADLNGAAHTVERITDSAWEPFTIFDTLANGVRRPLFFPPAVLVVAEAGQFALAFGSGDREQLWDLNGVENRFYMISDEGFARGDTGLPRTEANYTLIDSEGAFNPATNFLLQPPPGRNRGYVLTLDPNERVVAPAFSISGLTVFPTFNPQIINVTEGLCARTGDSRVFAVFTTSGDPVLPDEGAGQERYFEVGDALVTPPYVDQGVTGNAGALTPSPEEQAWREQILDILKGLFPPRTRFANYTIEVNFLRSDTGVVRAIPVPIGVVSKNWKQF